jgi:small multidrug resistance family-3 protein
VLGIYGFVATLQPDAQFDPILAWGMALYGIRPDRWDVIGAVICLAGVR